MLTDQQIERYSRQIILPNVGGRGQEGLLSASVALVGTGELCVTAAQYLAAAGVGRLTVPAPVLAAVEDLNPDCRAQPSSSAEVVRSHDVVISAGAPLETCRAVNAACVACGTPLVWGELGGRVGQVTVFAGHRPDAPCYQCARPQPNGEVEAADVLAGVTAALVGTLLATEALKAVLGIGRSLTGRMLVYDLRGTVVHESALSKDPLCIDCGAGGDRRGPTVIR